MEKYFSILFIFSSINAAFSQTMLTAKVIEIKDGDTVVVLDNLNNQTTLRLAEVDCPEKNQPFGTKSKQFTSNKISQKTIKYIVTSIDRYVRNIAKIYFDDNKYLSEEIIRYGFSWHYIKYSKSIVLAKLEQEATRNKRGL
jgi:endonuclease YncB( thermonuclease family)